MRARFEAQLELLNNQLIEMGALIESAIACAVKALIEKDQSHAQQAIRYDSEVDQKEKDIESLCLKLLLQQQPVAGDLRLISSALKMITDMERIGDQAADIAEITMLLADSSYVQKIEKIPQMATATIKMVNDSIDAFVRRDLDLANSVIEYDDVVDDLFDIVRKNLLTLIHEDVSCGEEAMDLLMIAKYFERIGDHATNIAEWVVFAITGTHNNEQIM
jgi:phosphate transport system protein